MKMRKFLFVLVLMLVMVFTLVSCDSNEEDNSGESGGDQTEVKTTYTVVFMSGDERFATKKVKEGDKLTAPETNPVKEGYSFEGWVLGNEEVNFDTLVVNKDLTIDAKFSKNDVNADLNVNETKDPEKTYYMVIGWWENPTTQTSFLTEDLVRLFYSNVILYAKAYGATDADIENITFRNYSSEKVATMFDAVKADGDVDMLIGVGKNVNSSGNLTLLNGNDGKCVVKMGTTPTDRYVAVLQNVQAPALSLYDWIKNTDTGKDAFNKQLKASEVEVYVESIDVTVTVHGVTDAVTVLNDRETVITMPEFEVPTNKEFLGLAKSSTATEADLVVGVDAKLKYSNIEELVEGKTLDLYPVLQDKPEGDGHLVVYVHLSASKTTYITADELTALETAFKALLKEGESVTFVPVEGVNGATFNTTVLAAVNGDGENPGINVDVVIGGNTIVSSEPKLADSNVSVAAGHFANDSRKALVLASSINKTLAQKLIDYLTTDLTTPA